MDKLKYCSLDIETTGFDPLKDEILELGFVFFEITEKGIVTGREYSRVFKPQQPVSEIILGLTGISKKELEEAPKFFEHQEEIQKDLEEAVIVGHNINFDIKFLQGLGIKFRGLAADTLDLAQFILPTHQSYNLENLMHYFGVPHTEAHRALADAKATLKVLEDLLAVFWKFDETLRQELRNFLVKFPAPWPELFSVPQKSRRLIADLKPAKKFGFRAKQDLPAIDLSGNQIINFSLGFDFAAPVAGSLKEGKHKSLLVLSSKTLVLKLWKQGLAEPVFSEGDLFNPERFAVLKNRPGLILAEMKFILKILVWQSTNWQTHFLGDLNLSFFGGQFKSLVNGGMNFKDVEQKKVLASDFIDLQEIMRKDLHKGRLLVVGGLSELENALVKQVGKKISWGYLTFLLKTYYNPQDGTGDIKFKPIIEQALADCDLFFGLVNALLQTDTPSFMQVELDEAFLLSEKGQKICQAAGSFGKKLTRVAEDLQSEAIISVLRQLEQFFETAAPSAFFNEVKWLELSPQSVIFFSSPVDISALTHELFRGNKSVIFCDCLPGEQVLPYFAKRLGLKDMKIVSYQVPAGSNLKDLFSSMRVQSRVKAGFAAKNIQPEELLAFCEKACLPAVILMSTTSQIRDFYNQFYERLYKEAFVLIQGSSGGGRILRNFSIHKDTLLLATGRLLLKSLRAEGAAAALNSLPVKTLVITHLPFEQYTHPYLKAVSRQFENPFEDFSLPRALLNLHKLIQFFHTAQLKEVRIFDLKLNKDYAKIFLNYLRSQFKLVE